MKVLIVAATTACVAYSVYTVFKIVLIGLLARKGVEALENNEVIIKSE
jgi:hypothetical protein